MDDCSMCSDKERELIETLKWNAAAMLAVLGEFNNRIYVTKDVLENIDLAKSAVQISLDEESDCYIIEKIDTEDAGV